MGRIEKVRCRAGWAGREGNLPQFQSEALTFYRDGTLHKVNLCSSCSTVSSNVCSTQHKEREDDHSLIRSCFMSNQLHVILFVCLIRSVHKPVVR